MLRRGSTQCRRVGVVAGTVVFGRHFLLKTTARARPHAIEYAPLLGMGLHDRDSDLVRVSSALLLYLLLLVLELQVVGRAGSLLVEGRMKWVGTRVPDCLGSRGQPAGNGLSFRSVALLVI